MKPFLLFVLFVLSPFTLSSQTTGKEFWICIPPNELSSYPVEALEIYVASDFDTEISVFDAAAQRVYKRQVKAGEIRTLSDKRGETSWLWEIREFEEVVRKGIRITSRQPISVYVLNAKVFTTDGYRAIPTEAWDTKHIVAAYSDFGEFDSWAGGFCVVARQPTTVKIKLQGTGGMSAKTSGGKSIGDSITVALDAGDVYAVCGDGTTRGVFDLTGTIITSSTPVGVFGFHQRTTMPNLLVSGNGRNHLVEALPPTSQWGKKYATTEFRRSGTNPNAKGDMFRIIASEPNTRWVARSYSLTSQQQTINAGGLLANVGDFTDLTQSAGPTIMPNGFTVFEADKPILVVQYSNSSSFDSDVDHDPFLIVLVPESQFLTQMIWSTPTTTSFTKHFLNVIVKADTADPNYVDNLKSIEIDGTPLWSHPTARTPSLLFNHMGNGLHWTTIQFGSTASSHRMTSNDKISMSGYVYGYGAVDAYGWPLASATRNLGSIDTMPPMISGTFDCGTFDGLATETRNIPNPPRPIPHDTDQVETGIADIDTVFGSNSYNFQLIKITNDEFTRVPSFKQFNFRYEVIDRSKPAYCEYYVKDWWNNITYDTLQYNPSKLSFSPSSIEFHEHRLNDADTIDVLVTNSGQESIRLRSAQFEVGQRYRLVNPISPPGLVIEPGQTLVLPVIYLADRETNDVTNDLDIDTLIVEDDCTPWKIGVFGVASLPQINVADYNAGYVDPGVLTCKSGGLQITNNGSDTLIITGFTGIANSKFSVSPAALTALPYVIYPKSSFRMQDVCYQRMDEGTDSITVTFQSNASGPKPTSIWKARTTVTSVEEDAPTAFHITATAGTITASWQGAGVARIAVWDVVGRQIHNVFLDTENTEVTFENTLPSKQTILIVYYDADGTPLYIAKEMMP